MATPATMIAVVSARASSRESTVIGAQLTTLWAPSGPIGMPKLKNASINAMTA